MSLRRRKNVFLGHTKQHLFLILWDVPVLVEEKGHI